MNITLLTIGKCRDKAIFELCTEYTKRLGIYWPTQVMELSDRSGDKAAEEDLIQKHLAKQKPGTFALLALDERGKRHTSRSFAQALKTFQDKGINTLIFVIGGANGLTDTVKTQAAGCFSLSDLTLPHMLVRPIILEQIYRAATILAGHPYHRE